MGGISLAGNKTNVMRILDKAHIPHQEYTYDQMCIRDSMYGVLHFGQPGGSGDMEYHVEYEGDIIDYYG